MISFLNLKKVDAISSIIPVASPLSKKSSVSDSEIKASIEEAIEVECGHEIELLGCCISSFILNSFGAGGGTRTPTPEGPGPKPGGYAKFAYPGIILYQ